MTFPMLQIDAFSDGPFTGNPAAVVPLEAPIDETLMQRIAAENNLSETAFTVPVPGAPGRFALRWFTPTTEVELCGHATLGAAAALRDLGALGDARCATFSTKSGDLVATFTDDGKVEIDLPALTAAEPASTDRHRADRHDAVERALDVPVRATFGGRYVLAILASEADVRRLAPTERGLVDVGIPVIATAAADDPNVDFVSRFFAPTVGVFEDPVTGSAHCQLVPYWASHLGKLDLVALQVSRRGGKLFCRLEGDRVRLRGGAHVYLRGTIDITGA